MKLLHLSVVAVLLTLVLGRPAAAQGGVRGTYQDGVTVTYTVVPSDLYTVDGHLVAFTDCLTANQTYTLDFAVTVVSDRNITARIFTHGTRPYDLVPLDFSPAVIQTTSPGTHTIDVRGTFRAEKVFPPHSLRRKPHTTGIYLEGLNEASPWLGGPDARLLVGYWCAAAPTTPPTTPSPGAAENSVMPYDALGATVTYTPAASDLYNHYNFYPKNTTIQFKECLTANQTYTLDFAVSVTTDHSARARPGMVGGGSSNLIAQRFTPSTIQTTGMGTDTFNVRGTFRAGNKASMAEDMVLIYLEGSDVAVLGNVFLYVGFPCVKTPITPRATITASTITTPLPETSAADGIRTGGMVVALIASATMLAGGYMLRRGRSV